MDQFLGPLTLWAAWAATGKARYRAAALASIRLALRGPPEGGALWRDGENCWISEYAWPSMKPAGEFHVLNGHLFGLLALAIFKEVAPADDLERAYACARNGTLAYQQRFYRDDGQWTWYQLALRSVINPPHYALIELSLLRSFRLVTGDSGYKQAEDRRIEQFRAHYPVEYSERRLLLARNGPPHPYMGDIYRPRVLCEHGERSWTLYGRAPVLATAAERLPFRCTVTIDTKGYELPLYTIGTVLETSAAPEQLTGPLAVELRARAVDGRSISFSPAFRADEETYANDEGRIMVGGPIGPRDTIALVVHSEKAAGLGLRRRRPPQLCRPAGGSGCAAPGKPVGIRGARTGARHRVRDAADPHTADGRRLQGDGE